MIIDKQLVLSNRKRSAIVAELRQKDFRPFPKVAKAHIAADAEDDGDAEEEIEDVDAAGADSDFDYLLNMALRSLTKEKVRLRFEVSAAADRIATHRSTNSWRNATSTRRSSLSCLACRRRRSGAAI
jgi:hypothetical protein